MAQDTQQKGSNNSNNRGNNKILNTNKKAPPTISAAPNAIDSKIPTTKMIGLNSTTKTQNRTLIMTISINMPMNASIIVFTVEPANHSLDNNQNSKNKPKKAVPEVRIQRTRRQIWDAPQPNATPRNTDANRIAGNPNQC